MAATDDAVDLADDELDVCTFCGGDGYTDCDDPIQCLDPTCDGELCECKACNGAGDLVSACPHGFPTPAACFDCMNDDGLGAPPVEPETMEIQFTARFEGVCPECGYSIVPGDTIVKTSRDRYLHSQCCAGVLS